MRYRFEATKEFWKNFHSLSNSQKQRVRDAWQTFKLDPFHASLRTHKIHYLSAVARHNIFSVVIEGDLRVIFRMDGPVVTTIDLGTHKVYE